MGRPSGGESEDLNLSAALDGRFRFFQYLGRHLARQVVFPAILTDVGRYALQDHRRVPALERYGDLTGCGFAISADDAIHSIFLVLKSVSTERAKARTRSL
jgi:O-acetyl-ADP-ribose deacetylase (regulator of RNase III)